MEGRINDILFVQTEEIAVADSLHFVNNLAFVCNFVADLFTYVFYHNIVGGKIFVGKKPISMDLARTNLNTLR